MAKAVCEDLERYLFFKCENLDKVHKVYKQVNMTPIQETNLRNQPFRKCRSLNYLTKNLKTIVLKMLNELKRNEIDKSGKTMHKQNENINEETNY